MAYLVVGAVTVQVITSSPLRSETAVGSVRRAFSGKPRSSVSDYFTEWNGVETAWLIKADADTLRAALEAGPPVSVSGDLTGSISVYVLNIKEVEKAEHRIAGVRTERVRLGFDMWAAA